MSKKDVEVNNGGVDEAFTIHHSDVCCNKAASVRTRRGRGGKQCVPIESMTCSCPSCILLYNGVEDLAFISSFMLLCLPNAGRCTRPGQRFEVTV